MSAAPIKSSEFERGIGYIMKKNLLVTFVGILAIFLPSSVSADAITCAENVNEAYDTFSLSPDEFYSHTVLQGFTVEESCTVTSVAVQVYANDFLWDYTQDLKVYLYDVTNDSSWYVGAITAPLMGDTFPGDSEVLTFTDGPLVLEPGTQYAVVLQVDEEIGEPWSYYVVYDELGSSYGGMGFTCFECDQQTGSLLFSVQGESVAASSSPPTVSVSCVTTGSDTVCTVPVLWFNDAGNVVLMLGFILFAQWTLVVGMLWNTFMSTHSRK